MLEVQIDCKQGFRFLMTPHSVLHGSVILPCLGLSSWYMCSCMNCSSVMCHLQTAWKCNSQQTFNSSADYIKHTDHLTTSNKANISRSCLDITFDISRRLADTQSKNQQYDECINTQIRNISE